jgi:hypothetical protein
MKLLRRLFAVLVWLVATVVVLLAAILCVTIILLPLGIPLMGLGMRMYGYGVMLMLPRVDLPSAEDVADGARKRWRHGKKKAAKSTKGMRKRLAV